MKKGLGIAQLSDYYVEPLLARGDLATVLDQYCYPFGQQRLANLPTGKQRPTKLQVLSTLLLDWFRDGLPW